MNAFAFAIVAAATLTPHRATIVTPRLARQISVEHETSVAVWVLFSDKAVGPAGQPAALAACEAALSDRALRRRALRRTAPGSVDARDLPVAPAYVDAVVATGARLRQTSRWVNAVSVEATGEQIETIAALPFVWKIQPVARARRASPIPAELAEPPPFIPFGDDPAWYDNSYNQLNQINVVAAHNAGYTGEGVIIGVLDTGFKRTHECFNQTEDPAHPVQVIDEHDFINDDDNTSFEEGDPDGQCHHGTLILGVLGAYHPTVLVGAAFDASFLLAKTEILDQEIPVEEDYYVAGLEWIEANGADLATSSLGYIDWYTDEDLDGQTAVTTVAVNAATDNGLVCCTAAGNNGHDGNPATLHLLAPADAFKVLSCGAVHGSGVIAGFSSDGPSYDGRVKPEVLARGVGTSTVSPTNDLTITTASGTSLSTPLVAGGTALIVQAHPDWSVERVRRALFHTAADFLANSTYDADYVRGYGVIDIMAAIEFVHGDIDDDGTADGDDIPAFLSALQGANSDAAQVRRSDANADGVVDLNDVPVFVGDLLGA